jgi:hypothetical protein
MTDVELAQILGFADCPRCASALARLDPVERAKQEAIAQGIRGDVDPATPSIVSLTRRSGTCASIDDRLPQGHNFTGAKK